MRLKNYSDKALFNFILGVYRSITNQDFASRRKIWFPEDFNLDEFEGLPSDTGFNLYEEPADKRKADAWVIKIPGTRKAQFSLNCAASGKCCLKCIIVN